MQQILLLADCNLGIILFINTAIWLWCMKGWTKEA
jgi:hypothetical protein